MGNTIENLRRPLFELSDEEKKKLAVESGSVSKENTDLIISALKRIPRYDEKSAPAFWWEDSEKKKHYSAEYLYHANSIITSVDFIRRGCLYSRALGDTFGIQTPQRSDDTDKKHGIYNDIFFDYSDLAVQYGYSVYGPVTFAFDYDVLKDHLVRVTRKNPIRTSEISYSDLFYTDLQRDFLEEGPVEPAYKSHHIVLFDTEKLEFGSFLKAVYVEKSGCLNSEQETGKLVSLLRQELDAAGFEHVPVIERGKKVRLYMREKKPASGDKWVKDCILWKFPE